MINTVPAMSHCVGLNNGSTIFVQQSMFGLCIYSDLQVFTGNLAPSIWLLCRIYTRRLLADKATIGQYQPVSLSIFAKKFHGSRNCMGGIVITRSAKKRQASSDAHLILNWVQPQHVSS